MPQIVNQIIMKTVTDAVKELSRAMGIEAHKIMVKMTMWIAGRGNYR